jgi:hypothetical protein
MRFSLLDPVAQGIRVEQENRSERKLGQIAELGPDWEIDPTLRFWKQFLIAQQEIWPRVFGWNWPSGKEPR